MWASCVWVENLLLLSLTVLDPKVHFWNKMHKENMSRCHQIWNRRSMKHFWNLTPVHKNFICKKNWDFQIKFSILMYQCSELLIKINLAWSKSAEEIPQVDSHHLPIGIFFSKNCSKKKKYVFWSQFDFFTCPNVVQKFGVVVLFSQFGCTHFSPIPTTGSPPLTRFSNNIVF